jgi:Amt family ammonium transporter
LLTLIIATVVHKALGLRATRDAELAGIDEHEHAETAYDHGRFGLHHAAVPSAHAHASEPL